MTSEEITTEILALWRRGEMPALEALKRLIAAGVDPEEARRAVGITLSGEEAPDAG